MNYLVDRAPSSTFQYILCFGSSFFRCSFMSLLYSVSIHPMFRFKAVILLLVLVLIISFNTSYVSVQDRNSIIISWKKNCVSIHPMFRFKAMRSKNLVEKDRVSIHPMFRFKTKEEIISKLGIRFQYILCFGSRVL